MEYLTNVRSKKKVIWIRADGNEEIASGHLARTLSIARELIRRGARVRYILADKESLSWLERITAPQGGVEHSNLAVTVLGLPYGMPERELLPLQELLQKTAAEGEKPDWFFVDSYAVTGEWFTTLREILPRGVRLAFLDDERAFAPGVDFVVNYDPDAAEWDFFYAGVPVRLLGPLYAPLREQFAFLRPDVRPGVQRILISTGGTDPCKMAGYLEKLVQKAGKETTVLAPGYPRVEQVAELFLQCDLAISAAGTTLYELCAAGVPTLAFAMADNQVLFACAMEKAGAVTYLGDIREDTVREKLPERIEAWLDAHEALTVRQAESSRMHALTDGRGSLRIAEALLEEDSRGSWKMGK